MDTITQSNKHKYAKYILWLALLCTELILGCITKEHPIVTGVALLGVISAICSAEGWYSTHFVFLAYAAGAATIAWFNQLYGDVVAMGISVLGSCIAIITWRKNLRRHKVKTRHLTWKGWLLTFTCFLILGTAAFICMTSTNTHLPILNTLVLGLVISAECLFTLRYCESYVLYFFGDLVLTLTWTLSGNWILVFTCILNMAFEIYGLFNWRKLARREKT